MLQHVQFKEKLAIKVFANVALAGRARIDPLVKFVILDPVSANVMKKEMFVPTVMFAIKENVVCDSKQMVMLFYTNTYFF